MEKATCWLPGCEDKQLSLGLCRRDYERYRAGDPSAPPMPRPCQHCGGEAPIRRGPREFCTAECQRASKEKCGFGPCGNKVRFNGLCGGHAAQARLGRELTVLKFEDRRSPEEVAVRDERGRKFCRHCEAWQHLDRFHRYARSSDGYVSRCLTCSWANQVKIKYGLSPSRYREMLAAQGGACAICRRSPKPGGRGLAVDHDHGCCPGKKSCGKCVRALLCGPCNSAIGLMRDSPDLLMDAAAYLKSF